MKITGKQMKRVVLKLEYEVREGGKHTVVLGSSGSMLTTLPRGQINSGTLSGILKRLGISKEELEKLL